MTGGGDRHTHIIEPATHGGNLADRVGGDMHAVRRHGPRHIGLCMHDQAGAAVFVRDRTQSGGEGQQAR